MKRLILITGLGYGFYAGNTTNSIHPFLCLGIILGVVIHAILQSMNIDKLAA